MRNATLNERTDERQDPRAASLATPEPVEAADILDWDAAIEAPAPRRSGIVRVTLEFEGRGRPIPIDEPVTD